MVRRSAYRRRPTSHEATGSPPVASNGALVLAVDPSARGDVGRVVPLHQGGRRGHPARGHDRAARSRRRAVARRLPRVAHGSVARGRGAARGLAPVPRPRRDQRSGADGARGLGRDPHRLERGRHRAVDGADLHVPSRGPVPPARARRATSDRRRRARLPRRRGTHRARHGGRLVGDRGNPRGRALVALVRERRGLRTAAGARHPGAGARHGIHARRRTRARAARARRPATGAARDDRARRPRRADPRPDVRRPAPPLPRAAPAREPQALDRDVPHARVRGGVRRRPARRVGDRRDARRVRAHRGGAALASGQRLFGVRVQESAA